MAREYFHCYHSMLRGTRNLSEAECGRLFRALLAYSAGDELINLQGREAAVFDVYAEQIDREKAAYDDKCERLRANGRKANATNCRQLPPNGTNCPQGEGEDEDKDEYVPPKSPKRGVKVFDSEHSAYKVAKFLSECIVDRLGIKPYPDATIQQWADAIDKVNRIDGRPWPEIAKVMEWCQYDSFWQANILSGAKFREKYPQLLSKVVKEENNA